MGFPDRLRQAREKAGYEKAVDAARALDIPVGTYNGHENGNRGVDLEKAARYSDFFRVSLDWLILGKIRSADDQQVIRSISPNVRNIPEYDVRVSAGPGFHVDNETKKRDFPFALDYLQGDLGLRGRNLVVLEVRGDSMEPTLRSQDRVLVDMGDRSPTQPGVFVLWDGDGTVVKRIEKIPLSDPILLRLKSDNPLHDSYEVPAEAANIVGRVVWVGRRL